MNSKNTEKKQGVFYTSTLANFSKFFFEKFAPAIEKVEGEFLPSRHLIEWALLLQAYAKTSLKSARFHLKTTIALGYLAWKLYRMEKNYNEWLFMGYKEDLGAYHLKRLRRYIAAMDCFNGYVNLTNAESIIHYLSPEGKEFICEPTGIFSFKRGRHPDGIIADDILRDPQVKLDIAQLEKITKVFMEEVESMPKEELHLFGTAQDENDLFSRVAAMPSYEAREYPATLDWKTALWTEKYPIAELERRRLDIGDKAFNKEFLCRPVRGEEGFLDPKQFSVLIKPRLHNYIFTDPKITLNEYSYGGFDIGKKTHPSHLSIFGVDRHKRLIQIHSKWFDGWNYVDQLEYLKQAIEFFNMARLKYDNTRAEFEGFYEAGDLPGEMDGVAFTAKNKYAMGADFDKAVTKKSILFLPDPRQKRQMLNVDNDLRAVATAEGHGDCFFSTCLALQAYKEGQGKLVWDLN